MTAPHALPAELSIYTVGELRAQCLGWMGEHSGAPLALQASAVDQVDAAGLQLLVSLSTSLEQLHQHLQLCEPSGALSAACAALGLNGWLARCTVEGNPS